MNRLTPLLVLLPAALLITLGLRADKSSSNYDITFETKRLSRLFFAEGAAFGDFNHDGQNDVVSGPFLYEGPDFRNSSRLYDSGPVDPLQYSDNFLTYAPDVNGDGWDDVLVFGFPGKDAYWFENPKKAGEPWPRHVAFSVLDNESPHWVDITGDGKPEIVCSSGGFFGYTEPDPADVRKPWKFVSISTPVAGGKFTHGLGVGDVNGDGRQDLLEKNGWWEQPANWDKQSPWKNHPHKFTDAGGSQMFAYDFDGDGDNDVVTSLHAHGYGLAWFENQKNDAGEVTFTRRVIMGEKAPENSFGVGFSQTHSLDLADMDNDGVKDLITGKRWYAHGPNDAGALEPAVLYWFQTKRGGQAGKVEFVPHFIDNDSGVGTQVMAGDVNKDGWMDVVVGNKKGTFVHLQRRPAVDGDGFRLIFDGQSLAGWSGDQKYWRVEHGAITGEWTEGNKPAANTFLFHRAERFADFHLKLKYRISGAPNANSGIQFRCVDQGDYQAKGYQADLEGGPTWLARIYDEHGRALLAERGTKVLIKEDGSRKEEKFAEPADLMTHVNPGDWNEYEVIASGPSITTKVNGKVMSQLVDRERATKEKPEEKDLYGMLAFQIHVMAPVKIQFKDVKVKRLFGDTDQVDVSKLE